jgi:EAL domain-containing protein (putative c-di-GMP-specific phosphodiesterase class I)
VSPTLLEKILIPGAVSTVFQPIYEVDATVLKPVILECLSRGPASTNASHAGVLFEYAQLKGAEPLVDRACIVGALNTLVTIAYPERFSLNVFAATLVRDTGFVNWIADELNRRHINPSNLVFELVEHGEAWDTEIFLSSLRDIRALGAQIALDDVGLAQSNFQRILDCNPEFLKLDRCIVHDCDRDRRRQAILRSLEILASDLGSSLIAEGVETHEELNALYSHDIRLFQGFLFSKPTPAAEIAGLLETTVLRKPPLSVSEPDTNRTKAVVTAL